MTVKVSFPQNLMINQGKKSASIPRNHAKLIWNFRWHCLWRQAPSNSCIFYWVKMFK